MVRPVERFRLSIAKARQAGSSGGTNISEQEAREALFPALKAQDTFERTEVAKRAGELKQFAVGKTTRQVFDCRVAAATAGASSSASKVDEAELKEGLALVAMQDLSPADRQAAVEKLRTAKLTATARALLDSALPDTAAVTAKAVARFNEVVALYRKPESEYQQNLNLPEASSALHELLAPGVDPAQATEAVRAVIAAGNLGSKAGPMLQAFAANPVASAPQRFECWLAHA